MRNLGIRLLVGVTALFFAGAASAIPVLTMTWTATTGTGTIGTSSIDANPGDVLTLHMSFFDVANGVSGAFVSLGWDAGDLVGGAAIDCPTGTTAPTGGGVLFFGSRFCANTDATTGVTPLAPGVVVGATSATLFDAAASAGMFTTGTVELGAINFTVGGGAAVETVTFLNSPGDSINDGTFFPFTNIVSSATVVVPEPATASLLILGLGALGFAGRRRA